MFTEMLRVNNFSASNGWLNDFKKRYDISFRKICSEEKQVDPEVCTTWLDELPTLTTNYDTVENYNANEIALFFQVHTDRTMVFKGERCTGGKHSKERIPVLFARNLRGEHKLPPHLNV